MSRKLELNSIQRSYFKTLNENEEAHEHNKRSRKLLRVLSSWLRYQDVEGLAQSIYKEDNDACINIDNVKIKCSSRRNCFGFDEYKIVGKRNSELGFSFHELKSINDFIKLFR